MKKITFSFSTAVFMAVLFQTALAQNTSPYWSLAGNSNATSTSKLGTTNTQSLRIIAGNVQRMVIGHSSGNVSIGATTLDARLTVNAASGSNVLLGQIGGTTKLRAGSNGGLSVGSGSTPPSNGLYVSGNVGIGTTSPSNKLHVIGRGAFSDGLSVFESGIYTVHTAGNALEGYGESTSYGSGVYGSGYRGVYGNGNSYGVQGYSYSGYGASFESYASWGLEARTTNGYYAGVFYGNVWTSGSYLPSDNNLKQDVQEFGDAMSLINKLKPRHYAYKRDDKYAFLNLPKGKHYGLMAQDVEEVLPNLVATADHAVRKTGKESDAAKAFTNGSTPPPTQAGPQTKETISIKTVNYTELIPILIKGMQEQSALIRQQQLQIDDLKKEVSRLSGNHPVTATGIGALSANTPNPVRGTTRISYSVPDGATGAQLLLTDNTGKTVRTVALNGTGTLNLNTSALSSGLYHYSLVIGGKIVASRKMEVMR